MAPRKSTASTTGTTTSAQPNSSTSGIGGDNPLPSAMGVTDAKSPPSTKQTKHSTTAAGVADVEKSEGKKKPKPDELGIDDLLLPRTLTSRLSRGTLPPNTSIQRDALLALTKSATVFISYLAHTANSLTARKTIQSADVLEALRETELWNVVVPGANGGSGGRTLGERVAAEVERWEGEVKGKRKGYRERVKARESGANDLENENEAERGPVVKRVRRGSDVEEDMAVDPSEDGDTDAAAAQLHNESAAANGDGTSTDAENGDEVDNDEDIDDEDADEVEDEEDESQDADPEDGDEEDDALQRQDRGDVDVDIDTEDDTQRRRIRSHLAPNGRVEVDSDEDSD